MTFKRWWSRHLILTANRPHDSRGDARCAWNAGFTRGYLLAVVAGLVMALASSAWGQMPTPDWRDRIPADNARPVLPPADVIDPWRDQRDAQQWWDEMHEDDYSPFDDADPREEWDY